MALLLFVFGYPLVRIFEFSFKQIRGIDGPWVGFNNYRLILGQDLFWETVRHNLFLLLASLLFYFWGENWRVWIFIGTTFVDFVTALLIFR